MRIAYITESFPTRSEMFVLGKVIELQKRGHQVSIFTQFRPAGSIHPDLLAGVDPGEVFRLPVWDRVRPKDLGRALGASGFHPWRIARLTRRAWSSGGGAKPVLAWIKCLPFLHHSYDLIHAFYGYMGLRYLEVMRMLKIPMVVSFHGNDAAVEIPQHPELYQTLFQTVPRFIAVADFLRRKVAESGCDPVKVLVIPTSVDMEYFQMVERADRRRECPVLITVGRLDWTKGYLYALEAMAKLREEGVPYQYQIVGEGRGRNEVLTAIRDFGLDDRVQLLGPLDREGVRLALAEADLFVLSSVTEGIAGVLIEAQATGLPVVATQVGGVPEAVRDGETGFLVPSRAPAALAERIRYCLEHPERRLAMGLQARQWVSANFNQQLLGDRLEAFYRQVIQDWARP